VGGFEDKVVVITGAGSGIGRATAQAFARAGARLHLADIDEERAREAAAAAAVLGARAEAHRLDCTRADEVEALAAAIEKSDGRVDVLHNNAGVCTGGAVEELSLDDWRWTLDVNLWGVIHGVHAFLPGMIAQGSGHIVNTASMAGLLPFPFVAPYVASKFAVVGLTEALGTELARHRIGVTLVCPGAVRTNVLADGRVQLPGDWRERFVSLMARYAPKPERVGKQIDDAVRRKQALVIPGAAGMKPLWLLKRSSETLYRALGRTLTRAALRKG